MTATRTSTIRTALGLLTVRLVLQQILLALAVFALSVLWLRIPDSSAVSVLATVLLALFIALLAGAGESRLLIRLTGNKPTRTKLLRGALILLVAFAIWLAWTALIEHLSANNALRAGYLNSQTPHALREILSYPHLLKWLGWSFSLLESLGTGVLIITAFSLVTSLRPSAASKSALRSLTFWLTFLLASLFIAPWIYAITQWTPGHGVRLELLSVILRLTLAVLLSGLTVSLVLAILSALVRRSDERYETPTGTPDTSHPLTTGMP